MVDEDWKGNLWNLYIWQALQFGISVLLKENSVLQEERA